MRDVSGGIYPAIILWENVLGAMQQNLKHDYLAVLRSFAGAEVPMPASGRWADAGMVRGRRCDLAWRVLDAQYWSKPKLARRERIFVVADFCKQVAEIEKGIKDPVMYVGNLSAKRDFTDVRDVVRAYALLVQKGKAGETYNIGTGHALAIQEILDRIISLSDKEIEVRVDAEKLRPVDVPIIEPDISKVHDCTGWKPQIPLEQTLRETLDYWRVQDLCQK